MAISPDASGGFRKVEAARGWDWLVEAFGMFKQAAGVWIGITVVYVVIVLIASTIRGGSLITSLFGPTFTAGIVLGCSSQASGQGVKLEHLFAGFRGGRFGALVLLAVIELVAVIALALVCGLIAVLGLGLSPGAFASGQMPPEQYFLPLALVVLIALALYVPILMGMWLSPALVVLRGIAPWEAFKLSFHACLANVVPFLLYGIVGLVIAVFATIPFGLGWLVAAPVFFISVYTSYRDLFPASPAAGAGQPPPF
jgi:uncharacterized membrane protein